MQIINPATEEIISEIREDTKETLASKFDLLKNAQRAWQGISLVERIEVLQRFSQLLEENIEKYLSDETMISEKGLEEKIAYEPLGIVCNISAWNYPYLVGVNVFVPALLAGNAVMYKPSEYSTLTGLEIEKLLKAAGVPRDVFHLAIGGKEAGEVLLELPFDGYFFTGSYKTGKLIY